MFSHQRNTRRAFAQNHDIFIPGFMKTGLLIHTSVSHRLVIKCPFLPETLNLTRHRLQSHFPNKPHFSMQLVSQK